LAQCYWQAKMLMGLNGPKFFHKRNYLWARMSPVPLIREAANGLKRAQYGFWTFFLMVLNGSSIAF
jgi:hypothetical protein